MRPNWDEYFLGMLDGVAKRATCDRGRSGAIITSRRRTILTTGYVGSAPGDEHCDEAGHYMITVIQPDGTTSQHCDRTIHAEENAILQAAMDGVARRFIALWYHASDAPGVSFAWVSSAWLLKKRIRRTGKAENDLLGQGWSWW